MVESLKEAFALNTELPGLPEGLPEAVMKIVKKGKMEQHEFWSLLESGEAIGLLQLTDVIRNGDNEELKKRINAVWAFFQGGQRRNDWEINHKKIKGTIMTYIGNHNSMPTVAVIARDAGLSRVTITNHLKEFSHDEFFAEEANKYRLAFFGMLDLLIGEAMMGNMQAIKTYIDVFKFAAKHSGNAGSFSFAGIAEEKKPIEITLDLNGGRLPLGQDKPVILKEGA